MNKVFPSAYIFMNKMHLVFRFVMRKPRTHFLKPVQNIPQNMVKHILTTSKKGQNKKFGMPAYIRTQYIKTLANSNYKPNRTYNTNITDSHIIII
jgi:hypothetical protein